MPPRALAVSSQRIVFRVNTTPLHAGEAQGSTGHPARHWPEHVATVSPSLLPKVPAERAQQRKRESKATSKHGHTKARPHQSKATSKHGHTKARPHQSKATSKQGPRPHQERTIVYTAASSANQGSLRVYTRVRPPPPTHTHTQTHSYLGRVCRRQGQQCYTSPRGTALPLHSCCLRGTRILPDTVHYTWRHSGLDCSHTSQLRRAPCRRQWSDP